MTGHTSHLVITNYSPANFPFSASCNTITLNFEAYFAPMGTKFTCTTGLTHCMASEHLYDSPVLCMVVPVLTQGYASSRQEGAYFLFLFELLH